MRLERAMKRRRKAIPSIAEVEMMLAEQSNDDIVDIFEGWYNRRKLPPEAVILHLIEGACYSEQKRFRKC